MLKRIGRFFGGESESLFCPAAVDDPVAEQTDWRPLKTCGSNFRTRRLVVVSSTRLEFRATPFAVFLYMVVLVTGLVLPLILFVVGFASRTSVMMAPLVSGALVITGGCLLYFGTSPIVFDRRAGVFHKGRRRLDEMDRLGSGKDAVPLECVYAVQITREYVQSEVSYYSYELNLVLVDGRRINVIAHGDLPSLRGDAVRLAAFLDCPLWDATSSLVT